MQNLRGRGFHDHTTRRIADDELEKIPSKRPSGIAFVTIEATIDPAQHLPRDTTLGTLRPLVFIYSLALPQEEITIPNGRDDKDKDPFDTLPRKIKITELETNTDGTLIAGTKNGTDVLEDYEEDVIAKLSQAAIKRLKSRSALKNPKTKDAPTTGLSSPKFALGGTRNNGSTITTYAGDYRFLESQAAFDSTFPSRTFEGAQAKTVKASIDRFVGECQYSAFTQLLRIDYVGSLDRVDIRTVSNITARIRRLHMTNRDDKASGSITSADDLFHEFLKLANLLPPDTTLWGLCLAHQFHSALTEECRSNMETRDNFQLPNPSLLFTKADQLSALRTMRLSARNAQQRIDDMFKQQTRFVAQYQKISNKKSSSFASPTDGSQTTAASQKTVTFVTEGESAHAAPPTDTTKTFVSPAETVIRQHTLSPAGPPTERTPVTTISTPDGTFPVNPTTGYRSKFPIEFRGCLGCGDPNHFNFRECPLRADIQRKTEFFKELHAHKPHVRERSEQRKRNKPGPPAQVPWTPIPAPANVLSYATGPPQPSMPYYGTAPGQPFPPQHVAHPHSMPQPYSYAALGHPAHLPPPPLFLPLPPSQPPDPVAVGSSPPVPPWHAPQQQSQQLTQAARNQSTS